MKRWFIAGIIILNVVAAAPAGAVEWGVRGTTFIGDIFSSGLERNTTVVTVGGRGVSFAHAAIDDQVTLDTEGDGPLRRGRADAAAAIRPRAHAPALLQAEAILFNRTSNKPFQGAIPDGAIVGATSFASDAFEYVGTTPTTLMLNYELFGTVFNLPVDPSGRTGADLEVAVLAATPNYRFLDNLSTLVQEEGATLLDTDRLTIRQHTFGNEVSRLMSLSFAVNPGEKFYVWQKLTTTAVRGRRIVDAFAPVESSFDQPDLVRSLSVVPEPASWALGLIGAAAVVPGGRSRRIRACRAVCSDAQAQLNRKCAAARDRTLSRERATS